MTTYSFATTRTDLGLEPGWAQLIGDTTALKPVSGVINRSAVATAEHFYAEGSSVSGTQRAAYQFGTVVTTTSPFLTVLGSGSAGAFNGYYLYPTSATNLRVSRKIAGTQVNVITTIGVAAVAGTAFQLEVVVGASNVISVYDAGGSLLNTFTDTTAGRPVSGYNGLYSLTSASSSADNGTNFQGNLQSGAPAIVGGLALALMGVG